MEPEKGEGRKIVVEPNLSPPAFFVVTLLTVVAFLTIVCVIALMARDAALIHLLFTNHTGVTGRTPQLRVHEAQRKFSVDIVFESNGIPRFWNVTLVTQATESSLVFVIDTVTRDAGFIWLVQHLPKGLALTGLLCRFRES